MTVVGTIYKTPPRVVQFDPVLARFIRWLVGQFCGGILQKVGYNWYDAEAKQGHDVGWFGHAIISQPFQYAFPLAIAVAGLTYVFWPLLRHATKNDDKKAPYSRTITFTFQMSEKIESQNTSGIVFQNSPGAIGIQGDKNTVITGAQKRQLSDSQRSVLAERLKPLKGHNISVYSDWNDSESNQFAYQFFVLFQSLGFQVGKMVGKDMWDRPQPPLSVVLWTAEPLDQTAAEVKDAIAVAEALRDAGLVKPPVPINVQFKATLTGESRFAYLLVGPQ